MKQIYEERKSKNGGKKLFEGLVEEK